MSSVASEIEIAAPPERVWSVVMDPRRLEEWVTAHNSLNGEAPRELSEGATFKQTLRVGGPKFEVAWTVVEANRPRRVECEGDGPAGSTARVVYELEPEGSAGTRFRYRNEFELPGGPLGRLAGRTVGSATARREAERSLANLKRLLEQGG
jgi:uncharacterized protein YndB with AHSA1/START domain